jgi:hypothetical protein
MAGPPVYEDGFLRLVLTPLRIRWTIPLIGSQTSSLTLLSPLIFLNVPSHLIPYFLLGSTKLNQYFMHNSLWLFKYLFFLCSSCDILKLVLELLLYKKTLTMSANFTEAAGVLQLNSYWLKGFRKPLVQSLKSFQKRLVQI